MERQENEGDHHVHCIFLLSVVSREDYVVCGKSRLNHVVEKSIADVLKLCFLDAINGIMGVFDAPKDITVVPGRAFCGLLSS